MLNVLILFVVMTIIILLIIICFLWTPSVVSRLSLQHDPLISWNQYFIIESLAEDSRQWFAESNARYTGNASMENGRLAWSEELVKMDLNDLDLRFGVWVLYCESNVEKFVILLKKKKDYIDDLVQDCSNSSANALELLQSCTKPSICDLSVFAQVVAWCREAASHYPNQYWLSSLIT